MKIALFILAALVALAVTALLVFVYVVQNVETPAYSVVKQDGAFEVRDYPSLVVAEVRHGGSRQESLSAGFGPLARYIFAKERDGAQIAMTAPVEQQAARLGADERIAMTAPVIQARAGGEEWSVRFIMPARYSIADLPAPGTKNVRLQEVPARRVAAIRFSGRTTDALIADQERRLRDWMAERALTPASPPLYAYYNDPFTPGFMRRNEILLDIAQ